jgi:hypothetical protein
MAHRTFAAALTSFLLWEATALAQSPPAPTFVYDITMSAGAATGSIRYTMDVAIEFTNPDGSRTASLTIHAPKMPPLDNKTANATLSPFGAITVGSTGEMPKGNYNPYDAANVKQAAAASTGPMMQMMINPLNTFANGLSKAVTRHEQRNGRDTALITMKTSSNGPSITGQGNYDPVSRLVVAVHCEMRQNADAKDAQVLDAAINAP